MGTKSTLLELLESRRGQVVSGQQAGEALGISRASVWKAVEALRAGGYAIQSVPGGGYRLKADSDLLSPEGVRAQLQDKETPVVVLESCPSTNLEAKKLAIEGAAHGTLVLAEKQTAGRGRLGKGFESPPGGLYMSLILRPDGSQRSPALITAAAGVSVAEAVSALCSIELDIKWVNDLYYEGKKCCGILAEGGTDIESGALDYIVVGIGLNYTTPPSAFDKALRDSVCSLYPKGNAPVPRSALAAAIAEKLMAYFEDLDNRTYLKAYRKRDFLVGKTVKVMANPPYNARVLRIDEDAKLVVQRPGNVVALSSGEISVQP